MQCDRDQALFNDFLSSSADLIVFGPSRARTVNNGAGCIFTSIVFAASFHREPQGQTLILCKTKFRLSHL